MINAAITNYIYLKFFSDNWQKELSGEALAANVVKAIKRGLPFYIDPLYTEDGAKIKLTQEQTTAICKDLGVELLIQDVQNLMANIRNHPKTEKILSYQPILMANQDDLVLLVALAVCFYDKELLRLTVDDPINGRVMLSHEVYKYLSDIFVLFV